MRSAIGGLSDRLQIPSDAIRPSPTSDDGFRAVDAKKLDQNKSLALMRRRRRDAAAYVKPAHTPIANLLSEAG